MAKEIMLTAANYVLLPSEASLLPMAEVVLVFGEPTYRFDGSGGTIRTREPENFRFHATAKALRRLAEQFIGYAEEAEGLAEKYARLEERATQPTGVATCIAEHPADDAEPVSTEWLVSLGFVSVADASDDELYTIYDAHGGPGLTLESDDQRCWMAFLGSADDDPWPRGIYVRAQVRQLLTALGVPPDPA